MEDENIRWLQWGALRMRLGLSHCCTLSLGKWPWSSLRLRERCLLETEDWGKNSKNSRRSSPWKINWTERGIPWAGRAWALGDCSEHHGLAAAVSVSAQPIDAQQTAIQGRNTRRRLSQWVPTSVRVYGNAFAEHKTICWHPFWVLAEINQWSH